MLTCHANFLWPLSTQNDLYVLVITNVTCSPLINMLASYLHRSPYCFVAIQKPTCQPSSYCNEHISVDQQIWDVDLSEH